MAQATHDGIIDDDRVYTTHALARIFGVKGTDTIERWLAELECPVVPLGTRRIVSGYTFRLAIERNPGVFPPDK